MNRWERKEKLGYGAISEIGRKLKLSPATVSLVVNDKTDILSAVTIAKVRVAVAAKIGAPVEQVFPAVAA